MWVVILGTAARGVKTAVPGRELSRFGCLAEATSLPRDECTESTRGVEDLPRVHLAQLLVLRLEFRHGDSLFRDYGAVD